MSEGLGMAYISKKGLNHNDLKQYNGGAAGRGEDSCTKLYERADCRADGSHIKECCTEGDSTKVSSAKGCSTAGRSITGYIGGLWLRRLAAAAFSAALVIGMAETHAINAYADNVTIETDEFGVAYVLKEDGTRDYSNVPALPTSEDASVSERTIIDSNRHDLGLNGPTKDQSLSGIPDGISKEAYEALSDNVINYDEISDIVTYRNPTYTKYYNQADATLAVMRQGYEDFTVQMKEQLEVIDTTIDNLKQNEELISRLPSGTGSQNGQTAYNDAALKSLKEGLADAQKGKRSIISALTSTKSTIYYAGQTAENALKPVRNQLISAIESLIVSYKTLETNRSLVAEQVALYESLYNTYKDMEAQSLSTGTVTASYLNQLNTARKTLAEVDAGLGQLKKNILVQCGYAADADVTIADIPDPDRSFLDGRDKAADKKLAVDGNPTVITAGKLSSYQYSSDGMKNRELGENEARGKAGAAFDALYNEVQRQLILADSAETSLKKAELTENSGRLKFDMGMLSRAEYDALKLQSLSYRANAAIARLNLTQAINNYRWALNGVMNVG